jgi:hypothetical protein
LFNSGILQNDQIVWENGNISFGVFDVVNGGAELEEDK